MPYCDHKGNEYESLADLARAYKLNPVTLRYRLRAWLPKGRSLACVLLTNTEPRIPAIQDTLSHEKRTIIMPNGRIIKNASWSKICEIFGIDQNDTFRDVGDQYTKTESKATRNISCHDHLGQAYSSVLEMCESWNITYSTYMSRRHALGWTVKKALTTPIRPNTPLPTTDPNGIWWESEMKMCRAWQIDRKTYKHRINSGYDMVHALTTPIQNSGGRKQKVKKGA